MQYASFMFIVSVAYYAQVSNKKPISLSQTIDFYYSLPNVVQLDRSYIFWVYQSFSILLFFLEKNAGLEVL